MPPVRPRPGPCLPTPPEPGYRVVLIVVLVSLVLLVRQGYDLAGAIAVVGAGIVLAGRALQRQTRPRPSDG